jgi:hypothetical protein
MTVTDILSKYDEKTAALALQVRAFLLQHIKNVTETPDHSVSVIGYGYGTGYKDLICTILLSKKGVKLGFYKGADLPDPAGLLTGTGKVHRFVEIKSEKDIQQASLKKLLNAALAAYNKRTNE